MSEPVLSEKTRISFGIAALVAVLAAFGTGCVKYGEWSAERAAITARDDRQDIRIQSLEDWKSESRLWQANTSNEIRGASEKLDSLLKENQQLNKVLLYTAGGERKKIPADN